MENELLNWVAPQIITVNPDKTESANAPGTAVEGFHYEFTSSFCS